MPLEEITAHPDWQLIERRELAERASRSQRLQLAVIGYGILASALAAWPGSKPWLPVAQTLLFAAAFQWMPLDAAIYGRTGRRGTRFAAAGVLTFVALWTVFTAPVAPHDGFWPAARLPAWWNLLTIPVMPAFLLWAAHRHPGLSHTLGLATRRWGYQAAIGLSLGVTLGLHMWTTLGALPHGFQPAAIAPGTLVWYVATAAGLAALGEELTLRGVLFRMLAAESTGARLPVYLRIIALNAPLYLVPLIPTVQIAPIAILAYGIAFSVLALILRVTLRSVVAPLAANIAFQVFIAVLLAP